MLTFLFVSSSAAQSQIEELYKQATEVHDSGDYRKAIELYTQVIELDPAHADAYWNRANLWEDDENDKALADYKKVTELAALFDAGFGNYGWSLLVDGQFQRARRPTARAMQLDPSVYSWPLNYGHTFAHAIEAITGYEELIHGEAVAIGMVCAGRLAARLGRVDAQFNNRQRELLSKLGLPVQLPDVDVQQLLLLMKHDKKALHRKLRFVLPDRIGHVELIDGVSEEDIVASVE